MSSSGSMAAHSSDALITATAKKEEETYGKKGQIKMGTLSDSPSMRTAKKMKQDDSFKRGLFNAQHCF